VNEINQLLFLSLECSCCTLCAYSLSKYPLLQQCRAHRSHIIYQSWWSHIHDDHEALVHKEASQVHSVSVLITVSQLHSFTVVFAVQLL